MFAALAEMMSVPVVRQWALLANIASTLYMVGVIWTVQLAHYPLMARVGEATWRTYHDGHTRAMGWIVMAPMIVELGTAGLLAFAPPAGNARALAVAGLVCVVLAWAVTFFVSVPCHNQLGAGAFVASAHRTLVQTNWLRTALWTGHGLIALEMLRRSLLFAATARSA
jgi:hypothetical protein